MNVKTDNPRLKNLIKNLKDKKGILKALGEELDKPNRKRAEVNLYKLNKEMEEGETALIPGKVLGYGNIDKEIKVAALKYSEGAKEKIKESGSEAKTIEKIIEQNPDKEKMKIIK